MKMIMSSRCVALGGITLLSAATNIHGTSLLHPARFGVIDIMPNEFSADDHQEPSLAVGLNVNYGKIAVHTFSWDRNLYASANTGGPPWTAPWVSVDLDATLDWSAGGACYLAMLPVGPQVQVRKSLDPTTTDFTTIDTITKGYFAAGHFPDQPWIRTVTVTNVDHIFVGYNDQSVAPPRTATVRWSMDGGSAWNETVIDKMPSPYGSDSPQVRLALSSDGKTAYGLFQRLFGYNGSNPPDLYGDVVFVRDDGYGGTGFTALGTGTLVANNAVIPTGTQLGAQRLAGSCDVVVHPYHSSHIYVAYTEVVNGGLFLRVQSSANSGASFNLVYSIPNAALPALAVASDGTVGLLYAAKNNTDLEIHFLKALFGNFINPQNIRDRILAKFPDNNPAQTYKPYIGDYFALRAVGYNFFGTFCASNDPQPSHFPSGVFYQRMSKSTAS